MEDDNDAAIALLLLNMTEPNKEEEEALTAMIPKKRPRHRARLTMRKYRGRKRRGDGTVKEENMPPSSCRIPSENEIFEVLWEDEQYYDCRVIDFLQVNEKMYYDIQFIEDGIEMHMIDANIVYPISPCRKLPRRK